MELLQVMKKDASTAPSINNTFVVLLKTLEGISITINCRIPKKKFNYQIKSVDQNCKILSVPRHSDIGNFHSVSAPNCIAISRTKLCTVKCYLSKVIVNDIFYTIATDHSFISSKILGEDKFFLAASQIEYLGVCREGFYFLQEAKNRHRNAQKQYITKVLLYCA